MSLTRGWICSRAFNSQFARTFSSRSRKSREIRGGKEPGSEAKFEREMKKMKHHDVAVDGDVDSDGQEVLLKITQDYVKRGTAMKYAKQAKFLGRQREDRSLSWDNIDKIRYLKQEHPEEWDIPELARSFQVPEKTIKKVLKSKFTADPARRHEQDNLARFNTGPLEDKSSSPEKVLIESATDRNLSVTHKEKRTKGRDGSYEFTKVVREKFTHMMDTENPKVQSLENESSEGVEVVTEAWDMEGTALDAELEESEEFSSISPSDIVEMFEKGAAPPKVVQKGREFYDEDGEFLYRV